MTEKFKMTGEWFLPSYKEQRVHGTLTFDPQDEVCLELYGSLNKEEIKNQGIILGLTSDGKQITLCECFMINSSEFILLQSQESGKPLTTYSVRYLLIGLHIETKSELQFNKISSEIFNLDEWLGISGFHNHDYEKFKNHEITLEYKLPESIEFEINDDVKGKFNFISNHSGFSRYQKSVTIKQRVEFQVMTANENSIEDLLEFVNIFQNFLTLALYKSTYPLSISLSGEKHKNDYENGEIYKKSIELLFSSRNIKLDEKPKFDFKMIFDYQRIKNYFPVIIKNWYSKYKLLEPAFDLVFEQFYNGNVFTINSFLNLAQSAETFHARVHNHTKMPKESYKKMKEDILKVTSIEHHSWLNDQFNFGNNLNLHSRLTELTEKYSNQILDKILGDKSQFVMDVKVSRNYYTHYSKSGEKKALKNFELFYLSERLKILLVCSFLVEIGFNKVDLSSFLDKIKWQLFNHLFDWRNEEKKS